MAPVTRPSRRNPIDLICPHVAMVAIVTPTVWIALLYMLAFR